MLYAKKIRLTRKLGLEKNGLAEQTLVIFTSDNGCSPAANVRELESKGHYLSYVFHGYCQPWMES
jgi:arylsulfatase A-like enzyme